MTLSHSTAARNAMLNALDDQVNAGTTDPNGDLVVQESAGPTTLATFALNDPAFGAAASSQMSLAGLPKTVSAGASGTADSYDIRDKDNVVVQSGTITGTGGGGDIEADNTSINSGQDVTLDSYSLTAPA